MLQLLFLAALSSITPGHRTAPAPEIVVSAEWVRAHLHDPDLVVLDVTGPHAATAPDPFAVGHIPGARAIAFRSIFVGDGTDGGLTMQIVPADSLRRTLERLGVSDRSTIVLYGRSKLFSAVARTFMTLDYLGLGARTHIMDGGFEAWTAAGGAVDTASPPVAAGVLHVTPRSDVVTDAAHVAARVGDTTTTIVDARAPEFYAGTKLGHYAARVGHVPGARNVYFLSLADSTTNRYLGPAEARARFIAAGVRLDRPVIVYCHIGQTASVDYVQLRRLGVPVRLYDGSFEEWSRNTPYPVNIGVTP